MTKSSDQLRELARVIAISTYNAASNTCVGTTWPIVHKFQQRTRDLRIGDMVVERTTCLMPGRSPLDAVGRLVKITEEPVDFKTQDPDFVWDEKVEGRPRPTEVCVYIRTLDGRAFRWINASFMSVPEEWPMRDPLPETVKKTRERQLLEHVSF